MVVESVLVVAVCLLLVGVAAEVGPPDVPHVRGVVDVTVAERLGVVGPGPAGVLAEGVGAGADAATRRETRLPGATLVPALVWARRPTVRCRDPAGSPCPDEVGEVAHGGPPVAPDDGLAGPRVAASTDIGVTAPVGREGPVLVPVTPLVQVEVPRVEVLPPAPPRLQSRVFHLGDEAPAVSVVEDTPRVADAGL